MDKVTFTGPIDIETDLDWTKEPVFEFETEVDALQTIEALGEDIRAAREQIRHLMRYMKAAARGARNVDEGDGWGVTSEAIINHSGLARQTVYNMLDRSGEAKAAGH